MHVSSLYCPSSSSVLFRPFGADCSDHFVTPSMQILFSDQLMFFMHTVDIVVCYGCCSIVHKLSAVTFLYACIINFWGWFFCANVEYIDSVWCHVCLSVAQLYVRYVSECTLFLGEPNSTQALFSLGDWAKLPRSRQVLSRQPSNPLLHSALCLYPSLGNPWFSWVNRLTVWNSQ